MADNAPTDTNDTAALLFIALGGTLVFAVIRGELTAVRAAALALLGALTLWCAAAFFAAMRDGRWPAVETHWGGLGGGLGGWRAAPSLVYLMATLGFGAMFTAAALGKDTAASAAAATANAAAAASVTPDDQGK